MRALDTRIPPPIVAAAFACVMWALSYVLPEVAINPRLRIGLAVVVAAIGGFFSIAGAVSFRRARTTVNPLRPGSATALVTSGVFRVTRNPMYLALALVLAALALFLASPVLVLGPIAFVGYINQWQIKPEERALSTLFGAAYDDYRGRVRRWL